MAFRPTVREITRRFERFLEFLADQVHFAALQATFVEGKTNLLLLRVLNQRRQDLVLVIYLGEASYPLDFFLVLHFGVLGVI